MEASWRAPKRKRTTKMKAGKRRRLGLPRNVVRLAGGRFGVKLKTFGEQVRVGSRYATAESASVVAVTLKELLVLDHTTERISLDESKFELCKHRTCQVYPPYKKQSQTMPVLSVLQEWVAHRNRWCASRGAADCPSVRPDLSGRCHQMRRRQTNKVRSGGRTGGAGAPLEGTRRSSRCSRRASAPAATAATAAADAADAADARGAAAAAALLADSAPCKHAPASDGRQASLALVGVGKCRRNDEDEEDKATDGKGGHSSARWREQLFKRFRAAEPAVQRQLAWDFFSRMHGGGDPGDLDGWQPHRTVGSWLSAEGGRGQGGTSGGGGGDDGSSSSSSGSSSSSSSSSSSDSCSDGSSDGGCAESEEDVWLCVDLCVELSDLSDSPLSDAAEAPRRALRGEPTRCLRDGLETNPLPGLGGSWGSWSSSASGSSDSSGGSESSAASPAMMPQRADPGANAEPSLQLPLAAVHPWHAGAAAPHAAAAAGGCGEMGGLLDEMEALELDKLLSYFDTAGRSSSSSMKSQLDGCAMTGCCLGVSDVDTATLASPACSPETASPSPPCPFFSAAQCGG